MRSPEHGGFDPREEKEKLPRDQEPLPRQRESQEALDSRWYERFEQIGSFQAYEYLNGDKQYRDGQMKSFLAGEINNPDLDYPKIDPTALDDNEQALLELKKEIEEQEENESVRDVYRWKINEKIAELRMLRSVAERVKLKASLAQAEGAEREEIEKKINHQIRRFSRYSTFIYGKPSLEVFNYTIYNLREQLETDTSSDNPEIRAVANELQSLLPQIPQNSEFYSLPTSELVEEARASSRQATEQLIPTEQAEQPGEEETLGSEQIKKMFEVALDQLRTEGWIVEIARDSASGISTNQEEKAVKIPAERADDLVKIQRLIMHEIGTHVARRVNGERSRLKLLGLGLDRYERGEEGIATMREQTMKEEVGDFSGLEGHLAISLAMGLDGTLRDFRQVYQILERYYYLKNLKSKMDPEVALAKAQSSAYKRVVRTFRGTDCASPGVSFTKDIIYREGNIGVWDTIKTNPSELMRFNVGKYDPANSRHIAILSQLGISDTDLEKLEASPE